ncbi:MAG TPA: SDR family oxidoreductase, partial [Dehalococcoidia bacterium]|nr:SDR family oxidoreductase [Dehalococcoidia bacterium]
MLLSGKVAIITGGAKGIGKGISLKFAEEGCNIAIADINEEEAANTLTDVKAKGAKGIFVRCDHTDSQQVQQMVGKVISEYGKIDILVNNAGGFGPPVSFTDLSEDEWDRRIALNLKGVFLCCRAVAPHMIARKSGKIINMASIAAIAAGPPAAHYGASKGGIMSLTLDLAVELARFNICVNSILPGTIRTDMWQTNIPPGA